MSSNVCLCHEKKLNNKNSSITFLAAVGSRESINLLFKKAKLISPHSYFVGAGYRTAELFSSPIQFIKIFDNLSLFQKTLIRNRTYGKPAVIIGEEHRFIAVEQMREISIEADIIIELYQKNTAPCAIIAALIAKQEKVDKILLLPVDHYIKDTEDYLSVINKSFRYADGVGYY